jgi:3-hydroxybutyryl-CoA dehydratase
LIFKIGDKYEENFIVSDEIYSGFISLFNDKNPLHTNDQFANINGLKGK